MKQAPDYLVTCIVYLDTKPISQLEVGLHTKTQDHSITLY